MTTDAQIEANRRNAQKSTGPRTEEGKAASARNALKHGLTSPQLILFDETEDEFEAFWAALREAHAPADAGEAALVERIAVAHWRLRRIWRAEAAAFNSEADERADETSDRGEPATLATLAIWPEQLAILSRYESALERQLHRLALDLDRMQRERHRRVLDQQAAARAQIELEGRVHAARRKMEDEERDRAEAKRKLEAELVGHPMADIIRRTHRLFADESDEHTKRSQSPSSSPSPSPALGAERAG
jgi:hypothetical protein